MDKVYFIKSLKEKNSLILSLLKDVFAGNKDVLIKMHFGEPGNKYAFIPDDIQPIVELLKQLNLNSICIDTPVAYASARNSVEGYEKVVKARGYEKLAPFIISDNYINVQAKDLNIEVCKELAEAENVLVVSRAKGHYCSGFGGAVKNLGMGGVTKKTKEMEHILGRPHFIAQCNGCGICVTSCPAKAIEMKNNQAEIKLESCWGCSKCILNCPSKCLQPEKVLFDDVLAQAASAVIDNLPQNTFYINFITRISKWCDCEADNSNEIISDDIGILFSKNPVAIDKASVDLVNKKNGKDLFREVNNKDPLFHIELTAKYTNKSWEYDLVEI